jgi:hypothetical protein
MQVLNPFLGQNELLSCFMALLKLQSLLSPADLLALCMLIEATIPFRDAAPDGTTWIDFLRVRAQQAADTFVCVGVWWVVFFGVLFFWSPSSRRQHPNWTAAGAGEFDRSAAGRLAAAMC